MRLTPEEMHIISALRSVRDFGRVLVVKGRNGRLTVDVNQPKDQQQGQESQAEPGKGRLDNQRG